MTFRIGCALVALALGAAQAAAQDTLKIAVGQINNWENQAPTLGEDIGIFKKHNLKIEAFGTQGAGETIQAVISGSADLGAGVGVAGVMRAFSAGRAGAHPAAGFHRNRRSLLVREGGFADQDDQGRDREPHHRLFDQWLEFEQHRGGVCAGAWREGEADRDRRPARDAHAGDDRPDRHRLGGAAVWHQGHQGRQDPHRGARQRYSLAARPDRARHHRECECA